MPPDKRRPLGVCKLLLVNLKTLSVTQSIARRVKLFIQLTINDGWDRMWKGAFVAQFELLLRHFSGSTEKNYENFR